MKFIFTNDVSLPLVTNLYASNGVVISNQDMTATGNNASYSVSSNEIILLGNVTVENNLTTLKGDKLLIDLETGAIDFMANNNQNNRIKGVLMQSEKKDE
jgi:lipopolysaccharide export system protein LptA